MGQTLPRFWHSCKKGGAGAKKFSFLRLFFAEPIFAYGMAQKINLFFVLLLFFLADNNTLCRKLNIFHIV